MKLTSALSAEVRRWVDLSHRVVPIELLAGSDAEPSLRGEPSHYYYADTNERIDLDILADFDPGRPVRYRKSTQRVLVGELWLVVAHARVLERKELRSIFQKLIRKAGGEPQYLRGLGQLFRREFRPGTPWQICLDWLLETGHKDAAALARDAELAQKYGRSPLVKVSLSYVDRYPDQEK